MLLPLEHGSEPPRRLVNPDCWTAPPECFMEWAWAGQRMLSRAHTLRAAVLDYADSAGQGPACGSSLDIQSPAKCGLKDWAPKHVCRRKDRPPACTPHTHSVCHGCYCPTCYYLSLFICSLPSNPQHLAHGIQMFAE